jgi:hypothetical protein
MPHIRNNAPNGEHSHIEHQMRVVFDLHIEALLEGLGTVYALVQVPSRTIAQEAAS